MKDFLKMESHSFYHKMTPYKARPRNRSSVHALIFKGDNISSHIKFDNITDAGYAIDSTGNKRYNYLHNLFTIAKKNCKYICHIKKSKLGEVFLIKDKDLNKFPHIKSLITS